MRRLAFLGILLGASPGLRAEPAETPFLIFREADPDTAKRIRDFLSEKQLGGQVPDTRRRAREELARIGPWSVPFLATALRKESSARIRMNAVLALMLIRDPRGLPVLREAAKEDKDLAVKRAATLALATFESGEDVKTLRALDTAPHADWRTIAPALARLRSKDAAALLKVEMQKKLPRGDYDVAAIVLASAIADPEAQLIPALEKGEKLVQEAAAIGLAVRPASPSRAADLLAAFERTKGTARVLAIRALGAIDKRPPEVQAKLLDIACRDGDAPERIAALLELDGREGECAPLLKAYQRVAGRNDPVAAALIFALARTRDPEAVEKLLGVVRGGSEQLRYHAAASLLLANGARRLDDTVRSAVAGFPELQPYAQRLWNKDDAARAAAAEDLREVEKLRAWTIDRKERNWLEVNRLMARILELVPVLNQFDASKAGRTPDSPLGGGGGAEEARKAPSGTPDEQDLFDLLLPQTVEPPPVDPEPPPYPKRLPYFGPEDLAVG